MSIGLFGRKIGMTQIFADDGTAEILSYGVVRFPSELVITCNSGRDLSSESD